MVCGIVLCADVEVEPETKQVIGTRLEDGYAQNAGSPGMLDESKQLRGLSEIRVTRTLVIPTVGLTPSRQLFRPANPNHLNGYLTNSHNDQLPVGLIAQLVEHCTGIAEVMGSNPVQA